ncbi:MAG: DUF2934 domain-containing protein [Betaproteobacteria bacterium]
MKESNMSVTGRKPARSREERWVESSDASQPAGSATEITQPSREDRIAVIAYYKAERRGFAGEHELEDWLEAERELSGVESGGMRNE